MVGSQRLWPLCNNFNCGAFSLSSGLCVNTEEGNECGKIAIIKQVSPVSALYFPGWAHSVYVAGKLNQINFSFLPIAKIFLLELEVNKIGMVYNPLWKDCRGVNLPGRSKLRCQQQCVEVKVHSLMSSDVGLFLKEADEEDDLNHHCNSLIKSDSVTAT